MERSTRNVYFWILLTALVCLVVRCGKLDGYSFPVYTTVSCPRNQSEWTKRSSVLNCTESNGYMCIPNENITELLEFCYRFPRIPIEENICLILRRSTSLVDAYSCKQFRNGCPDKLYWSNEIFKYPNCLSIGNKCFLAEPLCNEYGVPTIGPTENKNTQNKTNVYVGPTTLNTTFKSTVIAGDVDGNNTWVWILVIGVFLSISSVCVLIIISRRVVSHRGKKDISGKRKITDMDEMDREKLQEEEGKRESSDGSLKNYIAGKHDNILHLDETNKMTESSSGDSSETEYYSLDEDIPEGINSDSKQQGDSDRISSEELEIAGIHVDDYEVWKIEMSEVIPLIENGNEKKESEENQDLDEMDRGKNEEESTLCLDETSNTTDSSSENDSEKEYSSLEKDVPEGISSDSKQQADSNIFSSEELRRAGIHVDDYKVWKTEMSENYKQLSNEERAVLFLLLCSDTNTVNLENTDTLTKRASEMFGELKISKNISESIQALQSKELVSIENKNVTFASDDVQDETMFDYVHRRWEKRKGFFLVDVEDEDFDIEDEDFDTFSFGLDMRKHNFFNVFSRLSLDSSLKYLRSENYRSGKFVRCFPSARVESYLFSLSSTLSYFTDLLTRIISKLGKYILLYEILDDKALHSTISDTFAIRKCEPSIHVKENVPLVDAEKIEEKKLLSILDFGGQCMYYACHQIYLSKRAFYILVIDMSKNLEDVIDEELCDQKDTMFSKWSHRDYLLFWLKSVNCYCGSEAPVILVATHAEGKSEQEKTEYYQELINTFPMSSTIKTHLSSDRYFTISLEKHNASHLEGLDELEKSIVEVAKSQKHCGEEIPMDWAVFEKFISEKKDTKLQKLHKLKESFDELLLISRQEFEDLLRFYHDIGLILYFSFKDPMRNDGPQLHFVSDIVILDIQWFVNSFKYVMTDSKQASFSKVIDAAPTREVLDTFTTTGEISGTFLKAIWTASKNQTAVEYKDDMVKYWNEWVSWR